MRYIYFSLITAILFLGLSCKKTVVEADGNEVVEEEEEVVDNESSTTEELVRDSMYYYYNLYSYWTENVPDYTNLRTFTAGYTSYDEVMSALKALTPYYANYKTNIDRFSYFTELSSGGLQSRADLFMDTNTGYGMYFSFGAFQVSANNYKAYLVINMVEGGSPAARAGIRRGDVVTVLNDDTNVSLNLDYTGTYFTVSDASAQERLIDDLEKALSDNSLTLTVVNSETEEERELELTFTEYEIDPILKDTIYTDYSKKIGYLAFSSFEDADESNRNDLYNRYEQIFDEFEAGNIEDLILDMRYNTGGYVANAEYLANKLVGATGEGKVMYTYDVNDYLSPLTEGTNRSFSPVTYSRQNNMNLGTLYFLVTESTASAAELLINVLKPYMNVKLIADEEHTYGKPVGFFEQKIMNTLSFWPASFKTINADGTTDYWDGITADKQNVSDYIYLDFGNPEEDMIAAAINHSLTGSYDASTLSASAAKRASSKRQKLSTVNALPMRNMLKKSL